MKLARVLWLPILGLVAGLLLGLALRVQLPIDWARYTAVGILAALDSLLGAFRAELTFLGDRIGIDLYLVALVAFGVRIFHNAAIIRRHFL